MTTRVSVEVRDGRHQVRTSAGLLRAQRLHGPGDRARVALVGQTALLLGGDQVGLAVEVGPGATLELSDIAGTVAYHGRGQAASWHTSIRLGLGARMSYAGEPLVISDGADVTRTLTVDLAEGASACLRETVVFGRAGEVGGRLDATTTVRQEGSDLAVERLVLDAGSRARPGLLAGVRVVDSLLALGTTAPAITQRMDVVSYALLDEVSTITRFLGTSLADSPLTPDAEIRWSWPT